MAESLVTQVRDPNDPDSHDSEPVQFVPDHVTPQDLATLIAESEEDLTDDEDIELSRTDDSAAGSQPSPTSPSSGASPSSPSSASSSPSASSSSSSRPSRIKSFLRKCCCCLPCFKPAGKKPKRLPSNHKLPHVPSPTALLPPRHPDDEGKKTLVLDLDETLVHSSFKPVPHADFTLDIELEGEVHKVYVQKRPHLDDFLDWCALHFEVVIFTASLAKYADPLLDTLDVKRQIRGRLFREECVHHFGNYVKDLSQLGRRLDDIIIVDNSPYSYIFQPENAIPISSWFNDRTDVQLLRLKDLLEQLVPIDNVTSVLASNKSAYNLDPQGIQMSLLRAHHPRPHTRM